MPAQAQLSPRRRSLTREVSERILSVLESLSRRPWVAFGLIFGLSAAVRLILLLAFNRVQLEYHEEAERIGISLLTHGTFADPYLVPTGYSAHCPPFYPFLVSCIYRVFGYQAAGGLVRCLVLITMYSVLYGLAPLIARGFALPTGAGILAGLLSAALPLKRSAEIWAGWDEPYAALASAGIFMLTLRFWRQEVGFGMAALYGLCWGIAFHMAPSLLPVELGFCVVHLTRFSPHAKWRAVRWWAVALMVTALTVTPWTFRNHERLGSWLFMRSNLGLELDLSNQDASEATVELNNPVILRDHPSRNLQAALEIRRTGEVAYNRKLLRRAEMWISEHPGRFLQLTAERASYFWLGPFEHPLMFVLTAATSICGIAGLLTLRKSGDARFWLFATAWIVYPPMYYLVQYLNRYRVPIDWTVMLLAGAFLYERLRRAASAIPTAVAR
jgi:hypothetical protein